MKEITVFDKTEIYENEILPVVAHLRQLCSMNEIPMFLSIAVKNDESGTEYRNDMISAVSTGIVLKDEHLTNHVNVINGFETVPKKEFDTFDVDD